MKDDDVLTKMFMKLIIIAKQHNLNLLSFGVELTSLGERIQIYARMRHDSFTGKQPMEQSSCSQKHRDMEQGTEKEQHYHILALECKFLKRKPLSPTRKDDPVSASRSRLHRVKL